MSPRAAHRLIWDRFFKWKYGLGGNIPLDLALEHLNRFLKIVVRNIGHNATKRSTLDRYCKVLPVNKHIIDNWDRTAFFIQRSRKHVKQSIQNDLRKIVAELVAQKAFQETPDRRYRHFSRISNSLLEGFDVHSMFMWVNEHKKKIYLEKTAR